MQNYRITFENGDYFMTGFNGDLAAAKSYYLGRIFNLGTVRDNLQRCNCVEPYPTDREKVEAAVRSKQPVYITDGTVTRQAVGILDADCFTLDNGERCFVEWEQLGDHGNLTLMETDDGLLIAPAWFKN